MLKILFLILLFMVFGKIFVFAVKAAWGISKIIVSVILLPLFLVGLVMKGLLTIAFLALLVIGVLSIFGLRD